MAVLQAQTTNSNGYLANTTLGFQASTTASIANEMQVTTATLAAVSLAVGLPANALLNAIAFISLSNGYFINYLSRLARFFGDNAKQTNTHLIIQKTDLPSLTPRLSNTAESLLIAVLLRVILYESNSLISTVTIDFFKTEYVQQTVNNILLLRLFTLVVYSYPLPGYPYGAITNINSFPTPNEF